LSPKVYNFFREGRQPKLTGETGALRPTHFGWVDEAAVGASPLLRATEVRAGNRERGQAAMSIHLFRSTKNGRIFSKSRGSGFVRRDGEGKLYQAGDPVPATGIYEIIPHGQHRQAHEVVLISGDRFPDCEGCREEVRFRLLRTAPLRMLLRMLREGAANALLKTSPVQSGKPPRKQCYRLQMQTGKFS